MWTRICSALGFVLAIACVGAQPSAADVKIFASQPDNDKSVSAEESKTWDMSFESGISGNWYHNSFESYSYSQYNGKASDGSYSHKFVLEDSEGHYTDTARAQYSLDYVGERDISITFTDGETTCSDDANVYFRVRDDNGIVKDKGLKLVNINSPKTVTFNDVDIEGPGDIKILLQSTQCDPKSEGGDLRVWFDDLEVEL